MEKIQALLKKRAKRQFRAGLIGFVIIFSVDALWGISLVLSNELMNTDMIVACVIIGTTLMLLATLWFLTWVIIASRTLAKANAA